MSFQTVYKFHLASHVISRHVVPVPEAGPGSLILQVFAAGLCHLDIHCRDGQLRLPLDNFVGGHEIAGKVVSVGEGVSSHYIGKRYAVLSSNPCLECDPCKSGATNICSNQLINGYGLATDGGWQKYMVIRGPQKSLVEIPSNVSYGAAAVVCDSLLTPYHAIKKMKLDSSKKVLIIGAGGLGSNSIQVVRTYNCKIVVVDTNEKLKASSLASGALEFYTSLKGYPDNHFDAVIDVVGFDQTYGMAFKYIKPRGVLAAIGLGKGKLLINLAKMCNKEITVFGNFYGTKEELEECLDLVSRGLVKPVVTQLPFNDLNGVANMLRDGKIKGRAVFNPSEYPSKL